MKKIIAILLLTVFFLAGCRTAENTLISSTASIVESKSVAVVTSQKTESIVSVESEIKKEDKEEIEVPSSYPKPFSKTETVSSTKSKPESTEVKNPKAASKKDFTVGMWLSYYEIKTLMTSQKGFKEAFAEVLKNIKILKVTDLYIHIRSHCDSIFKSEYFPQTKESKALGFDPFQYMLTECHKQNIRVHAWLNPYRVSATDMDIEKLDKNSPAYKWLKDSDPKNDKNVLIYNGIYLNPGEFEARQLVLNGIKETIKKYSIDGIHFDDYFYPATSPKFDKESYKEYSSAAKEPLALADWRRANVDTLITDCNNLIENSKKKIVFSISPAADIEKNYNTLYADISGWVNKGYVDEIIPQLYFGFNHTDSQFNFDNLLNKWKILCSANKNVKLSIGLAAYKMGTSSPTDGDEWQKNDDILARQTKLCKTNTQGIVLFSYSSLFNNNVGGGKEKENLLNILKK